jgi:hypothetical protein
MLAMTAELIRLERIALQGRRGLALGFGRRKPFPIHAKHFQIWGLFLQTFPRIALVVSFDFNGLQGEKGKFRLAPNFCADPCRKVPPARG